MPKEDTEDQDVERLEPPSQAEQTVKLDMEPPDKGDDDDDDDKPLAAKGGEQKDRARDPKTGKWTERRQERKERFKADKAIEAERQSFERRLSEERAVFQRQIAELAAKAAQPGRAPAADPFDAALKDIDAQLEAELELIGADEKRGYTRYNQLRREEYKLVAKKEAADVLKAQQDQQRAQPRDQYASRAPIIESEYPWTMDPRYNELTARARSYKMYLTGSLKRPDTLDTDREALSHAVAEWGAEYGLLQPARPTSAQRNGYVRPGPGSAAPRENGQSRYLELPSHVMSDTGLSPEQIRTALREVE